MQTDHTDQSFKGVLLAFAAFAAYAWSDASVKLIDGGLSAFQCAFIGAAFGLAGFPFLMKRGDRMTDAFRTSNRGLWLLRFVAQAAGTSGSVVAFTHLSMAEAFVLIFLLPCFVTIMSVVFLKEKVGLKRWSAVLVGFAGTLIVLRPGFRELSIGHLGAVIGGLSGAILIICYRAIGPTEKNISMYSAGMIGVLVICGVMMLGDFRIPTLLQWLFLAGFGLLNALASILLMKAANHAPAAMIGPTQYSQMIWAVLFGYVIFGDHVDLPILVGIVLICGSGLLTLQRERVRNVPLPVAVAPDAQVAAVMAPDVSEKR